MCSVVASFYQMPVNYVHLLQLIVPYPVAKRKLLCKWDSERRIVQIKQGDKVANLKITRRGNMEAVALEETTLDASAQTE